MAKTIGGIAFGISMDTRKLSKDTKRARGIIRGFVGSVTTSVGAISGLSGALSAVAFAKFTTNAYSAIESLSETSEKLNVATEKLAGLRRAAEETGAGSAVLDRGLLILSKNVGMASQGSEEAAAKFDRLGVSYRLLARLSPDQQFRTVAEAIAGMTDKQAQLTAATDLFGTRGAALVSTLRLGKEGLDEAQASAEALGEAVSGSAAKGVDNAIDAFERMNTALMGVFREIAIKSAPMVEDIANSVTTAYTGANEIRTELGTKLDSVPILGRIEKGHEQFYARRAKRGATEQLKRQLSGKDAPRLSARQHAIENKNFSARFQARRDEEMAGRRQASGEAMFDRMKGGASSALGFGKRFAGGIGDVATATAKSPAWGAIGKGISAQIAAGVMSSETNANAMKLAGLKSQETGLRAQLAGTQSQGRGTLSFSKSGSAESLRSQADNKRVRENQKNDLKRNALLEKIEENTRGQQKLQKAF